MENKVILEYWSELTVESCAEQFEKLDCLKRLQEARNIVIKVNLAAGQLVESDSGVVTNPEILLILVKALIKSNQHALISIVESDSIGPGFAFSKFEHQNYYSLFKIFPQVKIVDLSRSKLKQYDFSGQFFKQSIVLPEIVVDADFFISLAKIKTHLNTVITGCLKNQFGCLPDMDKSKYHPYLDKVIADINSIIKTDLCILEGCPGMEGQGPVLGEKVELNLVMFATNPVAVDAIEAHIMGFDPQSISHLHAAKKAGLGENDINAIIVDGIEKTSSIDKFKFISREQRLFVLSGFFIQKIADKLHLFGHYFHLVQSFRWLIGKLFKKMLKVLSNGLH